MPLTRAQLISGDKTKGTVLSDQVQGVKQGPGVEIANDGTISFDPGSAPGVVRTNNENAFNDYVWPTTGTGGPEDDTQLTYTSPGTLSWSPKPLFGLGLGVTNDKTIRLKVPTSSTAPDIGPGSGQATQGSLYWDTDDEQLYIRVGGDWKVVASDTNINEALLSGAYTLYVNPEIGSDVYVTGTTVGGTPNQMVQAGYTPQKPFKTIARAALEVARLQIALLEGGIDNSAAYDRFVIKCSAGEHIVNNAVGEALADIDAWANGSVPSSDTLRKLNSEGYAGVILPRGVSIIGEDLRKTIIRPTDVPSRSGNMEEDRGSIFRITGGAFFFNFTFKDKIGLTQSHHLLDCFSFVSNGDENSDRSLENYYEKTKKIFGQSSDNDPVNPGETEIVAPQPPTATSPTDGVIGSSPYIFNCSIRSSYGLCGINADGQDVTGFKSMVVAQFTGTSLQRDMYCWQIYVDGEGGGEWNNITEFAPNGSADDYTQYIEGDPNNVRMNPDRLSFHIRAINNAFIQEVSVFAIGQGVHHWVKDGGEVSITNSNSTFGGCAAIAEGYNSKAFPQDLHWNVARIKVASNLNNQRKTVSTTILGVIAESVENGDTSIVLEDPLIESYIYQDVPEILASQGYTFAPGSYLWVENPQGQDWRAHLAGTAWNPNLPNTIVVTEAMNSSDNKPPGSGDMPSLAGRTVYIRRLQDTRTTEQRRYSFILNNTAGTSRTPLRDYVIQTTPATVPEGSTTTIADSEMTCIYKSGSVPPDGTIKRSEIVLGRVNSSNVWAANSFYRPGDTVRKDNKHYTCIFQNSDEEFDYKKWDESYVHMPSSYHAYDYAKNVTPRVIFDGDSDGEVGTTTCGYDFDPNSLTYSWSTDTKLINQYRSSTDYRGAREFLRGIGFTYADADEILLPRNPDNREINPNGGIPFPYVPSGGAATGKFNWPVEFRRPSTLRLFSHAWEWAGFLNYTKALPAYQKELSPQNQFTYYFTNKSGGRVYASGYNQEGLLVTAAGLTDLASGETIDVANIGNELSGIDLPGNNFENLSVKNLTIGETVTYSPSALEFAKAKTPADPTLIPPDPVPPNEGFGIVRLANINQLTDTENTYLASNDDYIDANPDVVTIGGLNRWKISQKLVSLGGGDVTIYVSMEDPNNPGSRNPDTRNTIEELLNDPPTTPEKAVRTFERAAQYANQVVSGIGSQKAIVKVAAGLYDPTSTWECNVTFVSYKSVVSPADPEATFSETNRAFPSVEPDFSDYYGYNEETYYGDVENIPNLWAFYVSFDNNSPSDEFRVRSTANQMAFKRAVTFEGGFAFLGIPKLISMLSAATLPTTALGPNYTPSFTKNNFVRNFIGNEPIGGDLTYTASETTNIDSLLNSLKADTDPSPPTDKFSSTSFKSAISCAGVTNDIVTIKDCSFGSVIPGHKEGAGPVESDAYIEATGSVNLKVYNIYIMGVSKITADGIGGVGAEGVFLSDEPPYGNTLVTGSWEWTQTHHTFISTPVGSSDVLKIDELGGRNFILTSGNVNSRSYYTNGDGLLPNHINLYNLSGGVGDDTDMDGPFFDQFIHAKIGLTVTQAWVTGRISAASGPVYPGFVGSFGTNTYNSTLTRGVRLGDQGSLEPESNYSLTLGRDTPPTRSTGSDAEGKTIFQKAGEDFANQENGVPPIELGTLSTSNYGEGFPVGKYPVITTADAGYSLLGLNLGIRCIVAGISPEYGNIIRYNSAI